MSATQYRFLPWVRRGLADRVRTDDADSLPARAGVSVGVTLSNIPEVRRDLALYGPGDVIGVDPRQIIRATPRHGSSDVEPNYFAQIEFDAPDFPWLFTPARASQQEHLRPWCVLVVVDLAVIEAPVLRRGEPLPVLTVPREAIASELPDLAESWAWAHAQVIAAPGTDIAGTLAADPALSVSRLVAPRRLQPGRRYAACLVPAFDAGAVRGLGSSPNPETPVGAAWTASSPDVRLPVYYHWQFSTGPQGDFESLARRLQPFKASARIGVERMYIGDAGAPLPPLPAGSAGAYLDLDAALRAPQAGGPLPAIPAPIKTALRTVLNAAAAQSTAGADDPIYGPPIYGGWHTGTHKLTSTVAKWLLDLNLDPRSRAAAGLGAAIVRDNQEQFMQWCWEQVGEILEANRVLSRATLSREVLARAHARHLATLPADRLFAVAGPLHDRTRTGAVTIGEAIARSSLPDAAADVALRRLTGAQRPVLRTALARAGANRAAARQPRVRLVSGLAGGALDVDPTHFVPAGVLGSALGGLAIPSDPDADVDLTSLGLPVVAKASVLHRVRELSTARVAVTPTLVARGDLATTGLLGQRHLELTRELVAKAGVGVAAANALAEVRRHAGSIDAGTIEIGVAENGEFAPPRSAPHPRAHRVAALRFPAAVHDQPTVDRLKQSLRRAAPGGQLGSTPPAQHLVPFAIDAAGTALLTRTNPRITVPQRVSTMLVAGDRSLINHPPEGVEVAPTQDRIMAAPRLDVPLYSYLARLDPTRLLPGVGDLPAEAITLLETNSHFIEGLLAGANFEMNRELLWRQFPTDQRGTPFRAFWDRGATFDIPDVHSWSAANRLGDNAAGGPGGQIALLVRGRLLHRYPNTAIYAWRAGAGDKLVNPPGPDDIKFPVFSGVIGDDIAFVGFDLTNTQLTAGTGWFFVLQEQPTEPRFGFDEVDGASGATLPHLTNWSDTTWEHTGTPAGQWLRIDGNPLAALQLAGARFVDHAGHFAAITLQKPFRVAIHARHMVEGPHA